MVSGQLTIRDPKRSADFDWTAVEGKAFQTGTVLTKANETNLNVCKLKLICT